MAGRARELCVSIIHKSTHLTEEAPSLKLHHLTKAPPMDTITMGIRISSYKIAGGHKGWDHSRQKRELAPSSSTGSLHPHSTASSFSVSSCNYSIHSITVGFTRPSQSSVNSISYSAYSMFPSPLLRPRGPSRKHWYVHFCKVPSLLLSGPSIPWVMLEQGRW